MREQHAVLVVGAGPTGLVLACDLARRGVAVRVIDKAGEPFGGSRAKALQPRSIEVLDDLGVGAPLVALGRFRMPLRAYDGTRVLREYPLHPDPLTPGPATPYTDTLIIPQWRIEAALRERLAASGVAVEWGTELVAFTQEDGDGVRATVASDGATEQLRASYLVGCDGGSSTVRRRLGVALLGETDETMRLLTCDVSVDGLDRDCWHLWPGHDGELLAICPFPATETFQLQVTIPRTVTGELTVPQLQRLVDQHSKRSAIRIRDIAWQSLWRYNTRLARQYRDGRVFLAGDAAHVQPPAGGQGMNSGMQDAYNLGWKLAHVLAGGPDELLDTYQEERLPIAEDVLRLASGLLRRGGVAGSVSRQGHTTDTLQLGLHYRAGSLSLGTGHTPDGGVTAGDRAPDAPCRTADGTPVRLFDLFAGPHVTLLAFGPRSARTARALAASRAGAERRLRALVVLPPSEAGRAEGDTVIDAEGHARAGYGVTADTLVAVRPDGYIGAYVGDGTDARDMDREVDGYLDRVLPARSRMGAASRAST